MVEGLPAGLPVSAEWVDRDLARRMQGYGRGARMKIEQRPGRVARPASAPARRSARPVAMLIPNRDWANWQDVMAAEAAEPGELRRRRVTRPRPGHADLVGRAQVRPRRRARHPRARERARDDRAGRGRRARPAAARRVRRGDREPRGVAGRRDGGRRPTELPAPLNDGGGSLRAPRARSGRRGGDDRAGSTRPRRPATRSAAMSRWWRAGWSSARQPRELGPEARRAAGGQLMSIPAVKGVEIGLGFRRRGRPGSAVHDRSMSPSSAAADAGGDPRAGFRRAATTRAASRAA